MSKRIFDMVQAVRRGCAENSAGFFTDEELVGYLEDGLYDIVYKMQGIRETTTKTSVDGTSTYSMPADCIAIEKITFDGDTIRPVTELEWDIETQAGTKTDTGQPTVYKVQENNLVFYPTPDSASASKTIHITYRKAPVSYNSTTTVLSPPYNIWDETSAQTGGKVSAVQGASQMGLTSQIATDFCAAGDYFGIKPDINTAPKKWYLIASVTNSVIKLATNYTGQSYTTTKAYAVVTKICNYPQDIIKGAELYAIYLTSRKQKDSEFFNKDWNNYDQHVKTVAKSYAQPVRPKHNFMIDRDNLPENFFGGAK